MSEENIIEFEKKIINLLLHYKDLVEKWLNSPLKIDCFSSDFSYLLKAIIYAFDNNVQLTRKTFIKFLEDLSGTTKREIIFQENSFIEINSMEVNYHDYPSIEKKVYDN